MLVSLIKLYSARLKDKGGKVILSVKSDKKKQEIRQLLGDKYLSCFYVVESKEQALELLLIKEAEKEKNNIEERIVRIEKEVHKIAKHFA